MIIMFKIIAVLSFLVSIFQSRITNSSLFFLLGVIGIAITYFQYELNIIGGIMLLVYSSLAIVLLAFSNSIALTNQLYKAKISNIVNTIVFVIITYYVLYKNTVSFKLTPYNLQYNLSDTLFNLPIEYFFIVGLLMFIGIIISNNVIHSKNSLFFHAKSRIKLIDLERENRK